MRMSIPNLPHERTQTRMDAVFMEQGQRPERSTSVKLAGLIQTSFLLWEAASIEKRGHSGH